MTLKLADRFMAQHPNQVGYTLSLFDNKSVIDFLEELPDESLNTLANHIPMPTLVTIFKELNRRQKITLCRTLSFNKAHILLLRLDEDEQEKLLPDMSSSFRYAHQYYQKIKMTQVGQMMTTDCFTTHEHNTVGQVKKMIKDSQKIINTIYVLDDEHHYLGELNVSEMMTMPITADIGSLTKRAAHTININVNLEAIIDNPGWEYAPSLPVLDGQGHLIGILELNTIYQYIVSNANRYYRSSSETVLTLFVDTISELYSSIFSSNNSKES